MIRTARQSDVEQIVVIFEQLHNIHCDIRSDYYHKPQSNFFIDNLHWRMNGDKYTIFVYEKESQIVAYASLFIQQKRNDIMYEIDVCHVEEFAVHENFRGQGIGAELIDYIKKYAVEKNCYHINLDVWYDNYDAVDFYSAIGFEPRVIKMEMKLI